MGTTHDQGVCIRQWDFSETSQTVSLFGRSLGVVRGLAKGARRERGAFDGGFDLLSRGEFGAIIKPNRDLATLTEWDLLEVFPRLRTDLIANQTAFYMADLVGKMLQPEDPHPVLFDCFVESLRTIGAARSSEEPPPDGAGSLLMFQSTLLAETGYRPRITTNTLGDVLEFAPAVGGVLQVGETTDGPRWKVRRGTIECIAAIDAKQPHNTATITVDRANRLLAAYTRHVLGVEPATMHAVFGKSLS
ncbi:MAG: DNA repair protein RecO [Planctomycetota bacterium]|nr:DNA repair protein RecO [Planctomycetota bacterium]